MIARRQSRLLMLFRACSCLVLYASAYNSCITLRHRASHFLSRLRDQGSSQHASTRRGLDRPQSSTHCARLPSVSITRSTPPDTPTGSSLLSLLATLPPAPYSMPLTKRAPSSSRNSPSPAGHRMSGSGFHPFGGRVSKHFGDSVGFVLVGSVLS